MEEINELFHRREPQRSRREPQRNKCHPYGLCGPPRYIYAVLRGYIFITHKINSMKHTYKITIAALFVSQIAFSQTTNKKPLMGWASWNQYGFNINEALFKNQSDAMVSSGLNAVGYEYINVDDGFFDGRYADGTLKINATKFPNGMKAVADYAHSKGLKAGFYSDAGESSCGGLYNGQTGGVGGGLYKHDQQDCDLVFKTWGFDFYKVDYCGGIVSVLDEETRYTAIKNAIDKTGREVNYNACRWLFPGTWITRVASSWRVSPDINTVPGSVPVWTRIMNNLDLNTYLAPYCSAGHYNDMDMLEVGRGMSFEEDKSHFSMWCIMSSPLLLGNDLTKMSAQTKTILTNTEVIALNQDTTALQAHLISDDGGLQVWAKKLNGRHSLERAVVLFNRSASAASISVKWSDLDLVGAATARDLWSHTDLGSFPTGYTATVPSRGVVVLKVVGTKAILQEVFEAEYAWLNNYNHIKNNNVIADQARHEKDATCSRGAKVTYLGRNADNYIEFQDVYAKVAGEYNLTISYMSGENRSAVLSVNGVTQNLTNMNSGGFSTLKDLVLKVNLKAGYNTIRMSNTSGWMPNFDKISLDLNKNLADVSIALAADKISIQQGEKVELSATASITGGTITKVEFFDGATLVGSDATNPYTFSWTPATKGKRNVTAVVTDNTGATTASTILVVTVAVPQAPYGGTAWAIPGKIEFENYDIGGNGVAYVDSTSGTATSVTFRNDEDVDIENCTDVGEGYNLGYTTKGEWLEYTVNVAKAGKYDLTLRVACNADNHTLSVSAKDVVVAKDVAIPNTAGWQAWTDVVVKDVALEAGVQVIRVTIGALDYVNLNHMTFTAQSQPFSLPLKAGWNLIGCSLDGSTDLSTALASIWPNVLTVKDMTSFYDKSQIAAFNSLTKISYGMGYAVKVDKDCELTWK